MKPVIAASVALALVGFLVFVLFRGFGGNPHEVPFMLSGKKAPTFKIKRLDTDTEVSLDEFKGRPIVLNFWATWCGPCKMEHPILEYAWQKYEKDAVFLGIVFEDTESNTKKFLADNGWTFPQLFDPKSTVAVDYGVSGVPETYFITRDGIIQGKVAAPFSDPRQIDQRMRGLLQ